MVIKSKLRNPLELFGLISEEEGERMLEDLKKIKDADIKLRKKRLELKF